MSRLKKIERNGRTVLLTRNLAPGLRVYNEDLLQVDGHEYRTWDPFRSKLAAAILKGLPEDVIKEGEGVLYLGTSTGTTSSHVSDLVGERGRLIGIEFAPRVAREFVEKVARVRKNVIPYVTDARYPGKFGTMGSVDVVYCDIAQQDQTDIAVANCRSHLKEQGLLLLVVKSRSIDVIRDPKEIFEEEKRKLELAGLNVIRVVELSPYDKDHAIILARMP